MQSHCEKKATFPSSRSSLWDHTHKGKTINLQLTHHKKLEIAISQQVLNLAAKFISQSKADTIDCVLIGSCMEQLKNAISVNIERIEQGSCYSNSNVHKCSGEVIVPLKIYKENLSNEVYFTTVQYELERLRESVHSSVHIEFANFLRLQAFASCSDKNGKPNVGKSAKLSLNYVEFYAVMPCVPLMSAPITPVPILPTSIVKGLANRIEETVPELRYGFLTMEQTRKLVFMLNTDKKASTQPLVGIWVSGVRYVSDWFVWCACLRYLFCNTLSDRVCVPPGQSFLLVLYSSLHSKPEFYDISFKANSNAVLASYRQSRGQQCNTSQLQLEFSFYGGNGNIQAFTNSGVRGTEAYKIELEKIEADDKISLLKLSKSHPKSCDGVSQRLAPQSDMEDDVIPRNRRFHSSSSVANGNALHVPDVSFIQEESHNQMIRDHPSQFRSVSSRPVFNPYQLGISQPISGPVGPPVPLSDTHNRGYPTDSQPRNARPNQHSAAAFPPHPHVTNPSSIYSQVPVSHSVMQQPNFYPSHVTTLPTSNPPSLPYSSNYQQPIFQTAPIYNNAGGPVMNPNHFHPPGGYLISPADYVPPFSRSDFPQTSNSNRITAWLPSRHSNDLSARSTPVSGAVMQSVTSAVSEAGYRLDLTNGRDLSILEQIIQNVISKHHIISKPSLASVATNTSLCEEAVDREQPIKLSIGTNTSFMEDAVRGCTQEKGRIATKGAILSSKGYGQWDCPEDVECSGIELARHSDPTSEDKLSESNHSLQQEALQIGEHQRQPDSQQFSDLEFNNKENSIHSDPEPSRASSRSSKENSPLSHPEDNYSNENMSGDSNPHVDNYSYLLNNIQEFVNQRFDIGSDSQFDDSSAPFLEREALKQLKELDLNASQVFSCLDNTENWSESTSYLSNITFLQQRINYVSMMLNETDFSDCNSEISSLARKYLNSIQTEVQLRSFPHRKKSADLIPQITRLKTANPKSSTEVTQYGLNICDTSYATRCYMVKHGLLPATLSQSTRHHKRGKVISTSTPAQTGLEIDSFPGEVSVLISTESGKQCVPNCKSRPAINSSLIHHRSVTVPEGNIMRCDSEPSDLCVLKGYRCQPPLPLLSDMHSCSQFVSTNQIDSNNRYPHKYSSNNSLPQEERDSNEVSSHQSDEERGVNSAPLSHPHSQSTNQILDLEMLRHLPKLL